MDIKKGVVDLYLPCNDNVNITSAFNPVMSNCLSIDIQLDSENQRDSPTSLSLILFLDNLLHNESFSADELIDTSTVGAHVGLSSRTDHPNVYDTWISVAPGNHELILKQIAYDIYYYPQVSLGKVMFSQVFVCSQGGGESLSCGVSFLGVSLSVGVWGGGGFCHRDSPYIYDSGVVRILLECILVLTYI